MIHVCFSFAAAVLIRLMIINVYTIAHDIMCHRLYVLRVDQTRVCTCSVHVVHVAPACTSRYCCVGSVVMGIIEERVW